MPRTIAQYLVTTSSKAVPYKIHKILTDNGIPFTNHDHYKNAFIPIFERVCNEHHIEHRKTKIKHLWTNGLVERMNRTLKEATGHNFHYASHDKLKKPPQAYLMAYNFVKRFTKL